MKKLWLIIALAGVAGLVFGAGSSTTLSWVPALDNTDGSAFVSPIKGTLLEWRQKGQTKLVGSIMVPAPATSQVVSNLPCGDFDFVGYTILQNDVSSLASAPPAPYKTLVQCKPNPPTAVAAAP